MATKKNYKYWNGKGGKYNVEAVRAYEQAHPEGYVHNPVGYTGNRSVEYKGPGSTFVYYPDRTLEIKFSESPAKFRRKVKNAMSGNVRPREKGNQIVVTKFVRDQVRYIKDREDEQINARYKAKREQAKAQAKAKAQARAQAKRASAPKRTRRASARQTKQGFGPVPRVGGPQWGVPVPAPRARTRRASTAKAKAKKLDISKLPVRYEPVPLDKFEGKAKSRWEDIDWNQF